MSWTATEARTALGDSIRGLIERRKVERRAPMSVTDYWDALRAIQEQKYTGMTVTHWAEGIPRKIEFPNPLTIEVSR